MTNQPDQFYIRQCLAGNADAFAPIVSRYQDRLYDFALRMVKNSDDAIELALIALEKAYFSLHQYQSRYAFSTWLYRILINETRDFCKKQKIPTDLPQRQQDPTPLEQLTQKEFWQKIDEALDVLPAEQRTTFILSTFHNCSVDEIAEIHDCPRGTVCWRLSQARKRLAQYLGNYCFERS